MERVLDEHFGPERKAEEQPGPEWPIRGEEAEAEAETRVRSLADPGRAEGAPGFGGSCGCGLPTPGQLVWTSSW